MLRLSIYFLLIGVLIACGSDESYEADRLFKQGKYEEAILAYNEVVKMRPSDMKSIYNRGRSYEEVGKLAEAKEDFERALKIDPTSENVLISIGSWYYNKQDFEAAEYHYQLALKNHPNSAQSNFQVARAEQKLGKAGQAFQHYNTAININKNFGEAYLYRGALNIQLNRKSSGCADLKTALSLGVAEAEKALSNYCK